MPTNLRFLEAKFVALERREEQHRVRSGSSSLKHQRYRLPVADPRLELGLAGSPMSSPLGGNPAAAAGATAADVADIQRSLVTTSSNAAEKLSTLCAGESQRAARGFQSAYSHHAFGLKQGASDFFRREQQRREANRVHEPHHPSPGDDDDLATFLTATQLQASRRADAFGEDGLHFRALFGSGVTPTPTPNEQQREEEEVNQALTIERMLSAGRGTVDPLGLHGGRGGDDDSMEGSRLAAMPPGPSTATVPKRVRYSAQRSGAQRQAGRPQTAGSSGKLSTPTPTLPVATGSDVSSQQQRPATATSRPSMDVNRLTRAFFNALPPVVPSTGVASVAKRVRPPSAAVDGVQSCSAAAVSNADYAVARPPSSLGRSASHVASRPIPPFALEPDYYYLQIKIVHAAASITHWTFTVVLTDVTCAATQGTAPKFQFCGLKANPQRYLIFQPPDSVILDPLKQLPWVASPASLYGHKLRLEVFATSPVQSKVIDSMVCFGEDR